jgi:lysophospholipase L1-like esterase
MRIRFAAIGNELPLRSTHFRRFKCLGFAFMAVLGCALSTLAQTQPDGKTQPPANAAPPRTGVLHSGYNPALPTLFLIGDSTVKNSWDKGTDGLWGWGNPLAAYFEPGKINVENQALGGTSSRSYINQGHWDRVLALVKAGDFVMMQFGHNDGGSVANGRASLRGNGDETQDTTVNGANEAVHSFGWYLRKYIADIKAKGATPIVCSLIPRNSWRDGKVIRAVGSYSTWAADAAKQGDALFIDLNSIIADHYDKLGEEAVKPLFPKEHTHTGWRGAMLNAQCVVEGVKSLKDCDLQKYLSNSPKPMKPASDPTDG